MEQSPTAAQNAVNDIAYIDVIDVCNLKCPTCVRGVGIIPNSGKKMPLTQFTDIVCKLKSEGFKRIGLFNWTEPFLNRTLEDYVRVIKDQDMFCLVSTNFSLRRIPNLEPALRAGIDYLIISVSGMEQSTYEINHASGKIDYVKSNIERTAALKKSGAIDTQVVLRLIKFPHNTSDETQLARYALELGIEFEVIEGSGDPFHNRLSHLTDAYFRQQIAEYKSERPLDRPGTVCPLMFGQAAIDWQGNAYLCCAYPTHESIKVGAYLDLPPEELLLRRFNHPVCAACLVPRRPATSDDKELLLEAVHYRLNA